MEPGKYYVAEEHSSDCATSAMFARRRPDADRHPRDLELRRQFEDVSQDGQAGDVTVDNHYRDAAQGTLPSVSQIVPNADDSEHLPASIATDSLHGLINAVMSGPEWDSTAIFLPASPVFYDYVVPLVIARRGVRAARAGARDQPVRQAGHTDHQTLLSFDASTSSSRTTSPALCLTRYRRSPRLAARRAARTSSRSATCSPTSTSSRPPSPPPILPPYPQ